MSKSKNQEWKESGSELSFKEWLRQDLNNTVHETVTKLKGKDGEYSNATGDVTYDEAASNYKPYVTGSVLGVNKYIVYTVIVLAVAGIGFGVYHHNKNK